MNNFNDYQDPFLLEEELIRLAFTQVSNQQTARMGEIGERCNELQDSILNMKKVLDKFVSIMKQYTKSDSTEKRSKLKQKLTQSSIGQLQQKLKALTQAEERIKSELLQKQSSLLEIKHKLKQMEIENTSLRQQLKRKEKQLMFLSSKSNIQNLQQKNTISDQCKNQNQQGKFFKNILSCNYNEADTNQSNKQDAVKNNSNEFINLNQNVHIEQNEEDGFQICDENEQINIGQSSINLQLRQIFNRLRFEIEKLFNQDQISLTFVKLLPQATQDDFYELMGYIKERIIEIKANNELSFIMAEPGKEPDPPLQDSLTFDQLYKGNLSSQALIKVIEEKEALIQSLMNDKTQQENTINQLTMQKQEKDEQNENRFMNQCNIYKKQIRELKKQIDILEMNFQSMKNVLRNVLQAHSTDEDMEDDFRESMAMYAKFGKLSQKQAKRINFYLQQYLKQKGIQNYS